MTCRAVPAWTRHTLLLLGLLLTMAPAFAVEPSERLADPALEQRARALSQELRCVVCQNTSIDESNATIAHDLRVLIRQRIAAGDSDQQILHFMVQRYGDFVLLRPRFSPTTYGLWLGPPALLLGGLAILLLRARRHGDTGVAPLSDSERARVDALLRAEDGTRTS